MTIPTKCPSRLPPPTLRFVCVSLLICVTRFRWCLRLIGQAKAVACLLNANAKLSTLGGGYFLTRQVGQAIRLARAQSQVREEAPGCFAALQVCNFLRVCCFPTGVLYLVRLLSLGRLKASTFWKVYWKTHNLHFETLGDCIALDRGKATLLVSL